MLTAAAALSYAFLASWCDWKRGVVPNALNAAGFLAGLELALFAGTALEYALFVLFSLCAGYLLYFFKVWGGGDAKLFATLSGYLFLFNGVDFVGPALALAAAAALSCAWLSLARPEKARRAPWRRLLEESALRAWGFAGAASLNVFAGVVFALASLAFPLPKALFVLAGLAGLLASPSFPGLFVACFALLSALSASRALRKAFGRERVAFAGFLSAGFALAAVFA